MFILATVEGDGSRSGSFPGSLKHVCMVGPKKKKEIKYAFSSYVF